MDKRRLFRFVRPVAEFFYKHDVRKRWSVKRYLQEHEISKLQLGSGRNVLQGWLNTDKSAPSCWKGAIYMDVGKRFLLPDESVNYVYSEHLFEHLSYNQARNMLQESFRVLKPGGVIRIATPNLEFLLDLYQHPEVEINKRYIEWASHAGKLPYSAVYVINRFHTAWGHRIIYDYETLSALLAEFGFKDIRRCEMSKSEHETLNNVEGHFHIMPYDFCCLETMIVEGTK